MITSLSPAATISNCNIAHVFMVVNHIVFQLSPAIKKIIIIIIITRRRTITTTTTTTTIIRRKKTIEKKDIKKYTKNTPVLHDNEKEID